MRSSARRLQTIADGVVLGEGAIVHELVNLYGHRTAASTAGSSVVTAPPPR